MGSRTEKPQWKFPLRFRVTILPEKILLDTITEIFLFAWNLKRMLKEGAQGLLFLQKVWKIWRSQTILAISTGPGVLRIHDWEMNELQPVSMRLAEEGLGISTTALTVDWQWTHGGHVSGGAPCLRVGGEPSARQLLALLILELRGQSIPPRWELNVFSL